MKRNTRLAINVGVGATVLYFLCVGIWWLVLVMVSLKGSDSGDTTLTRGEEWMKIAADAVGVVGFILLVAGYVTAVYIACVGTGGSTISPLQRADHVA